MKFNVPEKCRKANDWVQIFLAHFLKKSELISAVWLAGWLAGWRPEVSELGRDRDFRFFAIVSVDCGGSTIIKILNQAPLYVPKL